MSAKWLNVNVRIYMFSRKQRKNTKSIIPANSKVNTHTVLRCYIHPLRSCQSDHMLSSASHCRHENTSRGALQGVPILCESELRAGWTILQKRLTNAVRRGWQLCDLYQEQMFHFSLPLFAHLRNTLSILSMYECYVKMTSCFVLGMFSCKVS